MTHDQKDTSKDNCSTREQFYTACYGNIVKCDRFFHMFRFLHCSEEEEKKGILSRWLAIETACGKWEVYLTNSYAKCYNPGECLTVDRIIALFGDRAIFTQNVPKKHKRFGIIIYELRDSKGYTCNMSIFRQTGSVKVFQWQLLMQLWLKLLQGLKVWGIKYMWAVTWCFTYWDSTMLWDR